MRYDYRRIETHTLEGLRAAERLHARGWKVIQSGLFSMLMESPARPSRFRRPRRS